MRIKYLGHSCFLITSDKGVRIVTDPYLHGAYDGAVKYCAVKEAADIVTISHDHPDHCAGDTVPGIPSIFREKGEQKVKGVTFHGFSTYHDTSKGSERGQNVAFRLEVDGVKILHLGDLGHALDAKAASEMKPVDVLLMPVGGFFTMGAEDLDAVISSLAPILVIPMHYKTPGVDFPIAPVEDFLKGRKGVRREEGSEVEISAGRVPGGIIVLTPANLP